MDTTDSIIINELFSETPNCNTIELDLEMSESDGVITSLSENFQIKNICDVRILQEYILFNHNGRKTLYRGHESKEYKIESTITRLVKQKKNCSEQDVVEAERKAFDMFCSNIFKTDWLNHKLNSTHEDLFKMSIGRHLGLPCRLIDVTASLETAIWFAVMNPRYYDKDGEIIAISFTDEEIEETNQSPFDVSKVLYTKKPYLCDRFDELPLGEHRRLKQCGGFLLVDNDSLLNEENKIQESNFHIDRFTIPSQAKVSLAKEFYQDVYSGYAYQSEIAKIKRVISED